MHSLSQEYAQKREGVMEFEPDHPCWSVTDGDTINNVV